MIALGCMAIASLLAVYLAAAILAVMEGLRNDISFSVEWTPPPLTLLTAVFWGMAGGWLIATGSSLTRHHPSARGRCIAACVVNIVAVCVHFAVRYLPHFGPDQLWLLAGRILPLLAWVALPVFLICWLSRGRIRRQTAAWEYIRPVRPSPVWPTVLGTATVIVAAHALMQSLTNFVATGAMVLIAVLVSVNFSVSEGMEPIAWLTLAETMQGFGDVLLLIAGVMLIREHARAGAMAWTAAVAMVLLTLGRMAVCIQAAAAEDDRTIFEYMAVFTICQNIVRIALPVFLIVWLSKRGVRREIRSWKFARQQEAKGEREG
jgi:hypothetical protein